MQSTALLLIDIQNDFCSGGSLAVPDGDAVVAVANESIERARDRGWSIIATQDWHPADHGSFAVNNPGAIEFELGELGGLSQVWWPAHCVQGTQGAQLHPQLLDVDHIVQKGVHTDIDSYSGFFDNAHRAQTPLHELLQEEGAERLTVMGLATDFCVQYTVLDALELGYAVIVIEDGCRGIDMPAGSVAAAWDAMRSAGAEVMSYRDFFAD